MGITLTPVSRDEIPATSTRTTSESAQLFESFLAAEDTEVAMVGIEFEDDADAEAKAAKVASVRSTLGNYIDRHDLAVNLFTRNGALYMEKISDEAKAERKQRLETRRAEKAAKAAEAGDGDVAADATADLG